MGRRPEAVISQPRIGLSGGEKSKRLDLGQTVDTLANVGVIAGIIFLAIEIRQGSALLAAEALTTRAEIRRGWFEKVIESDALVAAIAKSRRDEALTEEEEIVREAFYNYTFTGWQLGFDDSQAGLLEEQDLPAGAWREYLQREPGMLEVWDSQVERGVYPPDFVGWMEGRTIN